MGGVVCYEVCDEISGLTVSYPCDVCVVGEFFFFEQLLYPMCVEFYVVCPGVFGGVQVECVFVGVDVFQAFFSEYNGEIWLVVLVFDDCVEPCLVV